MADDTTKNGRNESQAFAKTASATPEEARKARSKAAPAPAAAVTTRGQKYVSPEGRHSRQTHRRAEERAAADGHTTEKEQHDHDRTVVTAEIDRVAQGKVTQREQNARGATPKA